MVFSVFLLNGRNPVQSVSEPVEINVFTAGGTQTEALSSSGGESSGFFDKAGISPDQVQSIGISGEGLIDDPEEVRILAEILQHNAVETDEDLPAGPAQTLSVICKDGEEYSFTVKSPYLDTGTVWTCEKFFASFKQIADQN